MEKNKLMVVAGARPNFMKIAPLLRAFEKSRKWRPLLVHTGQHYDFKMSDVFFKELGIPEPDIYLNAAPGSHSVQTAAIMTTFEEVVIREMPKMIIVVGDVTSTLACSLVASKMQIPVVHVESGLRSGDRTMPEEINRLVTDVLSDYLFVSEKSGLQNLKREDTRGKKVHLVGNIMIDTLRWSLPAVAESGILNHLNLEPRQYGVITLHRPSNVDSPEAMQEIYKIFLEISSWTKLVYPVHPRTRKMMEAHGCLADFEALKNLKMVEPLGYMDFIRLVKDSKFVLTDSGGIQEETTVLKVPCITMRENTERPSTVSEGTNVLVGRSRKKLISAVKKVLSGKWKKSSIPKFWDGRTAERIVKILDRIKVREGKI